MIRALAIAGALALMAVPASAQMPADALGKPLPNPKLAQGTLTVRVFDGGPSEPIDGLVVTLTDREGKERNARTDAKGRAMFQGLDAGSTWVAAIEHEDKKAQSQPIKIPGEGGLQVVLSPTAWEAKPKPAGDGRPPPTQMSSRGRPERAMPPGSFRVRLLAGDWNKPIADHPVNLVGLRADGGIIHKKGVTDAAGRVTFENLRGRDVAYYALTMVPGPHGDERLMSEPVQLLPGVGTVMVISGSAPTATAPEDDLDQLYRDQEPKPEPGVVELRIGGSRAILDTVSEVELIEVSNPDVVAKGAIRDAETMVIGEFVVNGQANEKQETGHARIGVLRQVQGTPPIKGVSVELRAEGLAQPLVAETDDRGLAEFNGLTPGVTYTPSVVLFDKPIVGKPFTMPEKGGMLSAAAVAWETNTKMAKFSALPWGPEKIYVARVREGAKTHTTSPFQITKEIGAILPLQLVPPPPLRFHLGGVISDEYLHMEGMFMMANGPFSPYAVAGEENVFIPLPRGFVGARVEERMSNRVKVLKGRGLEWKGAVPPGGLRFEVSFSMKVEDGATRFDWDLPYGAAGSNLRFQYTDGMKFQVKGRAEGKVIKMRNGTPIYEMQNINIPPNRSMVMRVSGLPQHPWWDGLIKKGVGLVVMLLLGGALVGIFLGRGARGAAASEERRQRRDRLLDELAELERKHAAKSVSEAKYQKQKRRLVDQLEPLYGGPRKAS